MAILNSERKGIMNRRIGWVAALAYVATVWLANYFIGHVGTVPFPHGPHTIPVGFGLRAPSGVLWVGLAFTLRDFVQSFLGRRVVVGAIVVGAALTLLISPSLALASGAAFLLSELADFAVYTPLVESGRVIGGIALSNVVGTLIDTFLFLWLAFHSIAFWQGQVVGKLWMTALALVVLVPMRKRTRELVPA